MVKRVVAVGVLSALLFWLGAAPAGEPEIPLRLITADELKAFMDKKAGVDLIDVRSWDEYVKRHIKGARSMPIRAIPSRAHEIKKAGLAVFY